MTTAQREASRAKANLVRRERAVLKRRIKSGEMSVLDVLSEVPDWAEKMKFGELLEAAPFVGPQKTYDYMSKIGNLSYVRTLDRVTARQKHALRELLEAKERELERQRPYKRRAS